MLYGIHIACSKYPYPLPSPFSSPFGYFCKALPDHMTAADHVTGKHVLPTWNTWRHITHLFKLFLTLHHSSGHSDTWRDFYPLPHTLWCVESTLSLSPRDHAYCCSLDARASVTWFYLIVMMFGRECPALVHIANIIRDEWWSYFMYQLADEINLSSGGEKLSKVNSHSLSCSRTS